MNIRNLNHIYAAILSLHLARCELQVLSLPFRIRRWELQVHSPSSSRKVGATRFISPHPYQTVGATQSLLPLYLKRWELNLNYQGPFPKHSSLKHSWILDIVMVPLRRWDVPLDVMTVPLRRWMYPWTSLWCLSVDGRVPEHLHADVPLKIETPLPASRRQDNISTSRCLRPQDVKALQTVLRTNH